ncbi:MAG TPA: ABC transporter permease, partial [Armatimonadota bacterium]
MSVLLRALFGAARAEFILLSRSPLFVALAITQAVTLIFLVSLFGITGAMAPTALVDYDHGSSAQQFIRNLEAAHHSFALQPYSDIQTAWSALKRGQLVAVIVIPSGFTYGLAHHGTQVVKVYVDNINTDMTEDIQRALPSAITAFGHDMQFPAIRVEAREHDLIPHDTGYIPYLIVSALVLATLVIASLLAGMAVVREFESGTAALLRLSPVPMLIPLLGRVLATMTVTGLAMGITTCVVIYGYQLTPLYPLRLAVVLLVCIIIFSCLGAALGAAIRRTLPVTSLVFGLALPLYLISGSYEPERFDGNIIWGLAHLSPMYYAVGIAEQAVHGFLVTPES